MSTDIDKFIDDLSSEQVLELSSKLGALAEKANEKQQIQSFLKIEKILEDQNLSIKELMQIERHVKDLRKQKYTDGKGNFWSGRGKRPHWVVEAIGDSADLSPLKHDNDGVLALNKRKTAE